jgi:hypothetical protein
MLGRCLAQILYIAERGRGYEDRDQESFSYRGSTNRTAIDCPRVAVGWPQLQVAAVQEAAVVAVPHRIAAQALQPTIEGWRAGSIIPSW